jgi:hypothetical protein
MGTISQPEVSKNTDSQCCRYAFRGKQSMRAAGFLAMVLLILLTGAAQEPNFDAAGYPEIQFGAETYKDPNSGIIFYVESDARHVSAISQTGKLLWTRDPFNDAHLVLYRTKHPQIAQIGPGPKAVWVKGNPREFVYLEFNSSQFGLLRIRDGEFFFGGQN